MQRSVHHVSSSEITNGSNVHQNEFVEFWDVPSFITDCCTIRNGKTVAHQGNETRQLQRHLFMENRVASPLSIRTTSHFRRLCQILKVI